MRRGYHTHIHDPGQAGLGAGRVAGRPCVLATTVIRTSMYGLRDSTAAAVIGHHTPHARYLRAAGQYEPQLSSNNSASGARHEMG